VNRTLPLVEFAKTALQSLELFVSLAILLEFPWRTPDHFMAGLAQTQETGKGSEA
jgi:hypothetical protein